MKKEYKIVSNPDMVALIKEINLLLQDGWELCGGIAVTIITLPNSEIRRSFYQAMTITIK